MKIKLHHVNGNKYTADVLYDKSKRFVKLISLTNSNGELIGRKTITFRRAARFLAKKPRVRQEGRTTKKLAPLFRLNTKQRHHKQNKTGVPS